MKKIKKIRKQILKKKTIKKIKKIIENVRNFKK